MFYIFDSTLSLSKAQLEKQYNAENPSDVCDQSWWSRAKLCTRELTQNMVPARAAVTHRDCSHGCSYTNHSTFISAKNQATHFSIFMYYVKLKNTCFWTHRNIFTKVKKGDLVKALLLEKEYALKVSNPFHALFKSKPLFPILSTSVLWTASRKRNTVYTVK